MEPRLYPGCAGKKLRRQCR